MDCGLGSLCCTSAPPMWIQPCDEAWDSLGQACPDQRGYLESSMWGLSLEAPLEEPGPLSLPLRDLEEAALAYYYNHHCSRSAPCSS